MSRSMFASVGGGAIAANIAFTAVSASVAIPNNFSGAAPRAIRLAATQPCRVRFGVTAPTAVVTDMLIQPQNDLILNIAGLGFVAAIQESVAGSLSITALEDMR